MPPSGEPSIDTQPLALNLASDVPRDCRLRALAFLRPCELYGKYAFVSSQCHEDSRCNALPQVCWGEIFCGRDVAAFLSRMALPSCRIAFGGARKRLKLIGHVNLERPDLTYEEIKELAENAALPNIISLDLSVTSRSATDLFLVRSVSWALAKMFPNLQVLEMNDLSGGPKDEEDLVSELNHFNNDVCPKLRSIRWENRVGGCRFFRGNDLQTLTGLKELYFDHIVADSRYDGDFGSNTYSFLKECADNGSERCMFFRCNQSLEIVSLMGARYIDRSTSETKLLPQTALIKFVRNTPHLKWFRSDLETSNVQMLAKERPGIVFMR